MGVKGLALALALTFAPGCATLMELANNEDPNVRGPTYVLPRKAKTRHVLQFTCYWGDKLTCGPGIGTKWFEEWEWK